MKDQKDPREFKGSNYLALYQTVFARNMIYFPSESLKNALSSAANELLKFVNELKKTDNFDENKYPKALGARLLNSDGILKEKGVRDMIETIKRVMDKKEDNATDREVVIALLGDIGALFADTGATTGTDRKPFESLILRRDFITFLGEKSKYFDEAYVQKIQEFGGSKAVGPTKQKERTRKKDENTSKKDENTREKDGDTDIKETRSGIFNFGKYADEILNVTEGNILDTTWALALIDDNRLTKTKEPWAGHMSGSPAEILHTWDVLLNIDPTLAYKDNLNENLNNWLILSTEERLARAAGAAGFLVSMGYHSAMECVEGIFNYLGQNLRKAEIIKAGEDAGHVFKNGASTYILSGLFNEFTQENKKLDFKTVQQQIEDKVKTLEKKKKMKKLSN